MKNLNNRQFSKKIVIAILIVMSFNFISPNISNADNFGGKLFKPISQLLCGISDVIISFLQEIFIGDGTIKYGGIDEIETDSYFIRYSPGLIFAGQIPGLDVNFISPNFQGADAFRAERTTGEWKQIKNEDRINNKYSFDELSYYGMSSNVIKETSQTDTEWWNFIPEKDHTICMWEYEGTSYTAIKSDAGVGDADFNVGELFGSILSAGLWQWVAIGYALNDDIEKVTGGEWSLYEFDETIKQGSIIESSAKILQPTVATWYKALRAIALVGLLSVLVYIGIRILISSTGQEKAKYKKMIADWVAAICILFILQYIMVFILEITEKITEILNSKVIGQDGKDILMSNLRNKIGDAEVAKFSQVFAQTVMYLVLVIHTVMFSVQYLKRLVYMAFFTLIAPLIALTYPLDKVKDGQAQAFTTWIREYTFNALLQPMHLLLYYIFVSSASELVDSNPLYAIVAIGFLLPAEKFFRKMFGFDKASSASPLGAAAGGALIMNAVNKMGQTAGKAAAGKGEGQSGGSSVRTASRGQGVTVGSGGGSSSGSGGGGTPSGSGDGGTPPGSGGGGTPPGSGGGAASETAETAAAVAAGVPGLFGPDDGRGAQTWGPTMAGAIGSNRGIRNGVSAVGRKYINRNTAKKAGRMARKGLVGLAGAATLGTVGLAAGVATGDFGKGVQYAAAGAGAGYMGANNLVDKGLAGEKNLRETFKEGAIGQQEYNNLQSDRDFYQSNEFRQMLNDHELRQGERGRSRNIRNDVQRYRDSGITDTAKISTAMKAGLTPQEGAYAIKLAEMIGRSGWNNPSTRRDFESRYRSSIPTGGRADAIWNSIEDLL